MPRKKITQKDKKSSTRKAHRELNDYYVIITRTERRDYHYRVLARTEEEAIEFAVDEWNPLTDRDITALEEVFVDVVSWVGKTEEKE
ncbi:MAG: hypothetical protein ACTSSG_12450 [Candidatus Heimdallarchaeaceae archaeon]